MSSFLPEKKGRFFKLYSKKIKPKKLSEKAAL
jgi:hypothetical protein